MDGNIVRNNKKKRKIAKDNDMTIHKKVTKTGRGKLFYRSNYNFVCKKASEYVNLFL